MNSFTDSDVDCDVDSRTRMEAQLARCARGQGGGTGDADLGPRRLARRLSTLRADPRLVPLDPLTADLGGESTPRRHWSVVKLACPRIRW
jgi:hypothetical protein